MAYVRGFGGGRGLLLLCDQYVCLFAVFQVTGGFVRVGSS